MSNLLALLLFLTPVAALRVHGPLSPRNANYTIEASLDPATKTVQGHVHLSWRNVAAAPAPELVFHLYMNAFRNEASVFFRESHGRHRNSTFSGEHGWGAIDVTRLIVDGSDLTRRLSVDDTLGTVPLDLPIPPGATSEIDLDFTTRLPHVFARTGWSEDFFAVAQWFPKIAVFDGRWRAQQLHLNSEFFADFGVYDVRVDVPRGWVVGATGQTQQEYDREARTFVLFHAEDVSDFAWFASPRFVTASDHYQDVELRLLSWPGHESMAGRHLAAAKSGLAELERRYGEFPYSRLTIVDVPDDAEGAGGMEYPTLFTTLHFPVPAAVHLPEQVTIHELSHQYFQGMVASDEAEEAWLDEGLTEAMTDWGLSREFGRASALYDLLGHRLAYAAASSLGYRAVGDSDPPETVSFSFVDNSTYGAVTYSKTNLILRTAEALLGADKFEAGMRHYYREARFTHPRRADFVRLFDAGAGVRLSRFWHDTLDTSEKVDYQLLQLEAEQIHAPAGLFFVNGGHTDGSVDGGHTDASVDGGHTDASVDGGLPSLEREVSPSPNPSAPWRSEVVVHRRGTIALPVDLRVVFDDGSELREHWDDRRDDSNDGPEQPRWRRYTYQRATAVAFAEVDPDHKLALDVNSLNNGKRLKPDAAPRRRILAGWQRALSIALAAVGL